MTRQGVARRFTFGLVTDADYQLLQTKVKELSREFHANATVGTCHDGCFVAEVDIALQECRWTSRELSAKELELASFLLGRDVERYCLTLGHNLCLFEVFVVVTHKRSV